MLTHEWKKSSYSAEQDCVEVRLSPENKVQVRDSKAPGAGSLEFTQTEWDAFINGIKSGDIHLP